MTETEIAALPVPSPRQLKAIRAWLGLHQPEVATAAGLSITTILEYEKVAREPHATTKRALAIWANTLAVKWNGKSLILAE